MNAPRKSNRALEVAAGLARKLVHDRLAKTREGCLVIEDHEGVVTFGDSSDGALRAKVRIHEPATYLAIATGGTVGAGEAYMEGGWDADDLTRVVRILARGSSKISRVDAALDVVRRPFDGIVHAMRRNTVDGSRRNIHGHYDLGNDLFERMLDPTMMYSAGIFEREDATMEEASIAKLDRLCRKLELGPDDHVLEIGTGWGGFAIHAASRYGCRVTTTTISEEQFREAARRVREAGLEDRVTLLLEDYRMLTGTYSKIVSIEMIEAVGDEFLPRFFETLGERLAPDGLAAIQCITVPDSEYENSLRSVDFVKRYIFPGCQIPSIARLAEAWGETTDFQLVSLEDLTAHYVWTLRAWREKFLANRAEIAHLGYSERFLRMWAFYLAYCEGGFAERRVGDVQLLFARPRSPSVTPLPKLSAPPKLPPI